MQAVPILLLEHIAIRAIEVRHGRVEAVRTVRGAHHDGMGAPGFLLLEVGPVAERSVNHAMYCKCVGELRSDSSWAPWARRMELCAGATVAEHSADGGPAMIRRAAAVEVAEVLSASLPPCAECDGGRVRASGSTSTWRSGEPTGVEVAGGCARGAKLAAHVALVGAVGPKAGGRAALDERVGGDERTPPEAVLTMAPDDAPESTAAQRADQSATAHDTWLAGDRYLTDDPGAVDDVVSAPGASARRSPTPRAGDGGAVVAAVRWRW